MYSPIANRLEAIAIRLETNDVQPHGCTKSGVRARQVQDLRSTLACPTFKGNATHQWQILFSTSKGDQSATTWLYEQSSQLSNCPSQQPYSV